METYLVPMWVVECGVQRDGCISMVKAADVQAAVEALQAQLKTARYDAVRAFVRGEDKMCFVCGAKEPCELKDDPSSPCTFDPTPMELKQQVDALQRVRDEFERERDQLHAALMEAKAALDAEREKVARLDAMYRQQLGDRDKRIDALAGSAKIWMDKLTQLQALVRALPVVRIDLNGAYHDTLLAQPEDEAVKELLRYRATLDATTPAECPDCDGDGAVDSGGTDPNGNPLMRRCGCREKGGDDE